MNANGIADIAQSQELSNDLMHEILRHPLFYGEMYDPDIQNVDCSSYDANVRLIGARWFACIIETGYVTVSSIWCSITALASLNANDAAYPDCVKGTGLVYLEDFFFLIRHQMMLNLVITNN